MPRTKKGDLSVIEENLEGERSSDYGVITARSAVESNKGKTERSKKTSRRSNRGTGKQNKSETVASKRNRSRSKSKAKKERRNKSKSESDQVKLHDKSKLSRGPQETIYQKQLAEDYIEKERLRLEAMDLAERMKPKEVMPEDPLQRILSRNIHGEDIYTIQDKLDKLKDFKSMVLSQMDNDKYAIGDIFTNKKSDHPDLYNLNRERVKAFNFTSNISLGENELADKFIEKNFEALSDMHKKSYDYFVDMKKKQGDFDLIKPYPQFEELEEEILDEFVYPFHIDTPYYYGTKDIRPPYNETDAMTYEKSKKEWDGILKSLYGDKPVPELIPLTLEEMGVRKEFSKPLTEEQKEEYKNYYLDKFDDNVLENQITGSVREGSDTPYVGHLHSLPELLETIKDYYSGPTIKGCLEVRKQGLDKISKDVNTFGSFADKHLSYCSDNTLLTNVYLRNFEKLPNEFIMPVHSHFKDVLNECTPNTNYGVNRYLPPCLKDELLNILEKLGIYNYRSDFQRYETPKGTAVSITPTNSTYFLAQTFKRLKKDEQQIFNTGDIISTTNWPLHINMVMDSGETLSKQQGNMKPLHGMDLLRLVLELLEESYNLIIQGKKNGIGDTFIRESRLFDIERTKRYIILIFMGLIGPNSSDRIISIDDFINYRASLVYNIIEKHEKGLPDISIYVEKQKRNTRPLVKSVLSASDFAKYKNELVELEWKTNLISDMKDLHNYFAQKIRQPSERVNYGDDYRDDFKNYSGFVY